MTPTTPKERTLYETENTRYKLDIAPKNDPRDFDIILMGGPVWYYTMAEPLFVWLYIYIYIYVI